MLKSYQSLTIEKVIFDLDAFFASRPTMKTQSTPDTAPREIYREALCTLNTQGFCIYGNYPWDAWQRAAEARGVLAEMAVLGRAVMREAYQHGWSERLQSLCGWNDEGKRMIKLALRSPNTARLRWNWLLETDGLRVDPTQNYEWVGEESWTWPRRRRQWMKANRA